VDIGFRTTDFTIIDHLRYIERGSTTTDTGTSKCFAVIAKKLRQECGVNVELFRLYKAVETGFIKIRGHEYNISKFRDQVFANAAGTIASEIDRLWADDWDIDTIILTGGGSVELSKHLQPMIAGNVMPVENNIDTRLNNVQGYMKFGKHIWGKTDSEDTVSS
jgi:plasmid segregation protein ParM